MMKKTIYKLVAIGAIAIATFMVASNAQAQVFNNYWKVLSGQLQPVVSSYDLKIPALGGGGTLCLQTDNNGLISVASSACGTGGGGSGGGTWSTTTSQVSGRLINHSNNTNDVIVIGSTATTTGEWWYDPTALTGNMLGKWGIGTSSPYRNLSVAGDAVFGNNVLSSYFVATSTTASTFPLANITKLSNLTGNGFVKTSGGDGTLSVDTTTYESGLTAGDALTRTGNDFDFDGGASPGGELGGTWASPTIDDSLAVTSWNLTTPTLTSFFGTPCTGNQFLQDIGDTGTFSCAEASGSGGNGLATSTAIADTYVIYGTSAGTVGAEAAFTYDDATNVLTVDNLTLTNDLTVANGGTGASTLTGLLQGNGTSAFTAIADSSTVGQILRVTGASTYAWGALDFDDTDAFTGTLPNSALENSTISGIALGSNLANLTATDTTLTFSGTYNGSTARTIGLNLSNANTWTALQTFGNASTTLGSFGYASSTSWYGGGLTSCAGSANKLTWSAGLFGCEADATGGGSGGGTWSTTTSQVSGQFINYPNNTTDIVVVGSNATTSAEYWFDPNAGISYLSGNVGIGTVSPTEKLTVDGGDAILTTGTLKFGTGGVAQIEHTVGGGNDLLVTGSATGQIYFPSGGDIGFSSTGGLSVNNTLAGADVVFDSGKVGIGTTSPYAKLSVVGETVSAYFTATTTTPSTFPNASTTDFTIAGVVKVPYETLGFSYATSTWTGTTTIFLGPAAGAQTFQSVSCETNTGTLGVSLYDGTNRANYIPTASTTINTNTYSNNNTFTKNETRRVDVGTPASSPTKIACTFKFTYTDDN